MKLACLKVGNLYKYKDLEILYKGWIDRGTSPLFVFSNNGEELRLTGNDVKHFVTNANTIRKI